MAEEDRSLSFLHPEVRCVEVDDAWQVAKMSSSLKIMQRAKSLLNAPSSSLSVRITKAEDRLQKVTSEFMGRRLALPDEILTMVIELAAEHHRNTIRAFDLAEVSRRFRSIALKLPRIWDSMSSKTHIFERALMYIERSREMGLNVSFCDLYQPYYCSRLLQAAIPFASQWRSFAYSGYHGAMNPFC